MKELDDDILWPHFKPLWNDLRGLGSGRTLIAGGYGLYLKQKWLRENPSQQIVIPLAQWTDPSPRATADFDMVIDLGLIADEADNKAALIALEDNGFHVTEKSLGKRWQFVRELTERKVVLAELHAPTPEVGASNLQVEDIRVKHKPSLGKFGIHGRHNPQSIEADLHAFEFVIEGLSLSVPNPVVWSVMKLTAMDDQWRKSQDQNLEAEQRAFARAQAEKHAQDVCRTTAMTTIDERDHAEEVVATIRETKPFGVAVEIFVDAFAEGAWGRELVGGYWSPDDLVVIHDLLETWFATQSE